MMRRPVVCVVSRIAGLQESFVAPAFSSVSIDWHTGSLDTPEALTALSRCEVLVGEPAVCGPVVDQCPNLKWLQSTFAGCNQLLTDSTRRDYTATRLAGCFGPDMAEYCMLHILAQERHFCALRDLQQRSLWEGARSTTGPGLSSTSTYRRLPTLTLGVLGLGDIGSEISRMAAIGHRMRVVGCRRDASPRASDAASGVAHVYPLEELTAFLSQCDYLVSVLPSTPNSRGLLGGDTLSACAQRRPVLINVGRGDLLSEASILAALENGWLRHYVGDVFEIEPLPSTSALWSHPDVTVTPHNSAVTSANDVVEAFADNLQRYTEGGVGALCHTFDWETGY